MNVNKLQKPRLFYICLEVKQSAVFPLKSSTMALPHPKTLLSHPLIQNVYAEKHYFTTHIEHC